MNLAVSAANCRLLVASALALIASPAVADEACRVKSLDVVTVSGIIHGPRTEIRPIVGPDGVPDYSIVETIDEYELTASDWPCGGQVLIRYRYGHVKAAGCADGVPATVSGIYDAPRESGLAAIEVMSPGDLKCAAEKH